MYLKGFVTETVFRSNKLSAIRRRFRVSFETKKENRARRNMQTLKNEDRNQKSINEMDTISKKTTKKSTFLLSTDLHKRLKTAAVEKEMTMLEIVEEALEDYLRK